MECKFKVGDKVIKKVDGKFSSYIGTIEEIKKCFSGRWHLIGTVNDLITGEYKNNTIFSGFEGDFELYQSNSIPLSGLGGEGIVQILGAKMPNEQKEAVKHKCRCDFRELLMKGCQCNGV